MKISEESPIGYIATTEPIVLTCKPEATANHSGVEGLED